MNWKRSVALVGLLLALVSQSGCSSGMGQVKGLVTWPDGSPATELAGGQVIFESQAMRLSARGVIGKDGRFTLRTSREGDGAPVGDYEVAIVEHRVATAGEGSPLAPQRLPEKYSDFPTSGLKATVKPGLTPVTLVVERLGDKN
jgi:hypothetical protein